MNNHLNNPSEICDGIHLCLAWYLGSSGCTAMATSPSMVSGRVVATATSPSSVRDRTQSHSKEVHQKKHAVPMCNSLKLHRDGKCLLTLAF